MAPRLDEKLNLVVPVERDKGTCYIHSTPISREAFEAHFRIIAATHADLFGRGGAYAQAAPRVATLTLKDIGKREAQDGGDGGAGALLAEIKRLSVAAVQSSDGWKILPVDTAISQGFLDAEDWQEVESVIVFFTSIWWMTARKDAANTVKVMASAIGLSITPSSPSEWMSSLPSSTPAATSPSAPTAQGNISPSSIPS